MIEEQNCRLKRLSVSVEGYGARLNAFTTEVVALESKGGMSANVMVVKADIDVLKKEVA